MGQSKPHRPTAIVVEDDDIQREMLALLLERNFEVLQCEDAETAALALKARHPVLIVTDINLVGKMDGVDLAHYARQQNADVRIIVISGRELPRALPPGAKFFTKPVYPTALLAEAAR
jgi:DNA-binding response OmpR family regulator